MTHSIDADPDGDLLLKLGSGDEVTLIRVHSKVLSLASPVFAAMLSPRFAEGQALEDSKAMVDSTTTTIALPDDDPTAMSLLCKTLHYKEDAAQQAFHPPNILMGMAVICDKYNMSRALSPWSHIWMDTCHREDQFDLFQTAEISYGLAHHESFWKSTRDILRHSKIASLNIEYSLLPDKVIGSLRIELKGLLDQLQSRFETLVSLLLECGCDTEKHQGGVQSCEHIMVLGKYIKCLYDRGFWPISKIQIHSISEVSSAFDSFPNLENTSAEQRMMGETGCSISQDVKLKSALEIAVGDVDCRVTGLCLSCVKDGRYTEKDGNCHASFECQVDERLQGHQSAREDAP